MSAAPDSRTVSLISAEAYVRKVVASHLDALLDGANDAVAAEIIRVLIMEASTLMDSQTTAQHDGSLRLECLKLALRQAERLDQPVMPIAREYEKFVIGGASTAND